MITAENSSDNIINADNSDNVFTANSNICMNSTDNNLHDYFSFDIHLVSNYINNQLIYYYIFDIIFTAEQAYFDRNLIRFFINCQKIILILIILDEQLKIILNNII